MKRFFILGVILAVCAFNNACSDDDTPGAIIPEVATSTFTDSDGQEYQCITIGNLTWMAENLKRRLDAGSFEGCLTWEEEIGRVSIPGSLDEHLELVKQPFIDSVRYALDNGIITNEGYEGNPIFAQPVNAIRTSINNFEKGRIPTIEEILNSAINFTEAYNQLLSICANLSPLVEPLVAESTFEEAESSNGNYVEKYGYLYTYIAAEQAIPEGWRLPTDEDWKSLETALGMLPEDLDILDEWRGNGQGDVLKEGGCGFDVLFGGSRMYGNFAGVGKSPYVDKGSYECFWTSTPYMQNDSTELAITRGFSVFSNGILRGTSDKTAAFHVRCVKDAN